MDDRMTTAQGSFTLGRLHDPGPQPLRAWDAADEYALDHVGEAGITAPGGDGDGRWLVVNDAFGALTVALADPERRRRIQTWSDSVVAHRATLANLDANGRAGSTTLVASTDVPSGPVDVAIVKVPRTLAQLADQLHALRGLLHEESTVIGAGMTKSVHTSTIDAFERLVGPTPTTRARKKARLLLASVDPDLAPSPAPEPLSWSTDDGIEVVNLANVFSRQGLDRGTRLLLAHLPELVGGSTVVDLGCGNGVVAATLAARCPDLRLICTDESYQAVGSAEQTLAGSGADSSFVATDVLDGVDGPVDLVVCNPPFHAGGARTTSVAERMFAESARILGPQGELRVVANRHLHHHVTLRRHFDAVDVVASDPKFVVLSAKRPSR